MTRQEDPPRGEHIGHDVYIRYVSYRDVQKAGLIENHPLPDGGRCEGVVTFDIPVNRDRKDNESVWKVLSWEPLTLSPSLQCTECAHHGFIQEGRWVPA